MTDDHARAAGNSVSRIALVKPDRARAIEQLLARMAQSGQLRGRVSEDQLIDVLDQVRTLALPCSRDDDLDKTILTRGEVLIPPFGFTRSRRWRRVRVAEREPNRRARSL